MQRDSSVIDVNEIHEQNIDTNPQSKNQYHRIYVEVEKWRRRDSKFKNKRRIKQECTEK